MLRNVLGSSVALRAAGLAALASAAPMALALHAGARPALALGAAATAAAAIVALARLLRPVASLARGVEHYADHRRRAAAAPDDLARIARGIEGLEARLDAAARRADPARLEDPLTGLPNRLAVMRRARDEISRARRKSTPLSVALMALDGFADLERVIGRIEAERLLRLTAEAMVQTLRAYDLVGRWEGAVFVAVLPEAEIENAADAMRRLCERLAEDTAGMVGGAALSASAGVAVLQPDDATLADIAGRAQKALERGQARGGAVETAPGPRTRPPRITTV